MCLGSVHMAFIKLIIKVEHYKPKSAESDIDFYTEVYRRWILKITSGHFQSSQAGDCQKKAGVAGHYHEGHIPMQKKEKYCTARRRSSFMWLWGRHWCFGTIWFSWTASVTSYASITYFACVLNFFCFIAWLKYSSSTLIWFITT